MVTISQLRSAFQGADLGNAGTDWYRSRGHKDRNNDGLCQGISNAALFMSTGIDPSDEGNWFLSATDAWDASPTTHDDIHGCTPGQQLHFAIPEVPDGHVLTHVYGNVFLHAHSLVQAPWGDHLGLVEIDWFLAQRPWYKLRGVTSTIGSRAVALSPDGPPAPGPTQRLTGSDYVFRRTGPSTEFPIIGEDGGVWDPGHVIDMHGYMLGQDPYGDGRRGWYLDAKRSWSWAAKYTEDSGHDIADATLEAPAPWNAPPVVVAPEPEPTPTPEPEPEEPGEPDTPVEPEEPNIPTEPEEPPVTDPIPTEPTLPTPVVPVTLEQEQAAAQLANDYVNGKLLVGDAVIARIRTGIPLLLGPALAFGASRIPAVFDFVNMYVPDFKELLYGGASAALGYGYWALAKQLGKKWPRAEKLMLGSSKQPVYINPVAEDDAAPRHAVQ
jgi:hypothetical protein